ncbi:Asp23/Gls24 family envelope stress response protein [Candidatus Protofrankia californiensis]|uniref:Asp23/Gls24 family envelope stress response protein n=1 Tax=Candidatus Protofrankia californiensis TaxID=1839754 RepID=UPI001041807A|nr:Asp23/Gls24 family envelope stress response protein [Candidatus Protofrankia californiensis]
MSTTTTEKTATATRESPQGDGAGVSRRASTELVTGRGKTLIADSVVRKIAGVATREVEGVHNLGSGGARAVGSLRQRIPGSSGRNVSQGVGVEVGERQAAIDLDVVVDYGVSIVDLAQTIRGNVVSSVEGMTGLEVTEVNIAVDDIFIPEEDEGQPARVQ